jgi:tetratricopeptide (TPR) repeat protein
MSDTSPPVSGPFVPKILDEEIELRSLSRALTFSDGFSLLFAYCYLATQRKHLIKVIKQGLPGLAIQEIHFDKPVEHLLDELRRTITDPAPDAVFVSGLEYSLPVAVEPHTTPFVANLNAARNSFSHVVHCPLALWVPEYAVTAIARGAPDFFSIRSGVYDFSLALQEADSLTAGNEWEAENLPLAEKQERVTTIKNLLMKARSLPPSQRIPHTEARLLTRLGTLHWTLGQWEETLEEYEESLAIFRKLEDRHGEGRSLNNLANVYHSRDYGAEAITLYEQSLDIRRELGERMAEGHTLNNLGAVYQSQGRWAEAITAHEQSLAISRELGDRIGEGRVINNLGILYKTQGCWAEAIAAHEQSLAISRELGDRLNEGRTLNNLGVIYVIQGRWTEAQTAYEQSLAIRRELGDQIGEGRVLSNLARLFEAQGSIDEALDFARHSRTVLDTTEDDVAKMKAQHLVEKWENQQFWAKEKV